MNTIPFFLSFALLFLVGCENGNASVETEKIEQQTLVINKLDPVVGADQLDEIVLFLKNKKVGCVVNHTSMSTGIHLVDRLLENGIEVQKVFAPEHGFRGKSSAGEQVKDQVDLKTGLPIVSLYGKNKKPTQEMIKDLDVLVFDIQDVGARFYTYISTMHYVMEAAAQAGKQVLILDRPNPNGHYVDGPIREEKLKSFISLHPIPVVHGLTVAELAQMINGEGWLEGNLKVDLKVVKVQNYKVGQPYKLPISPSPNLNTQSSIYLYPSLCFFEGTIASIGRGTTFPFQVIGHPDFPEHTFSFTPAKKAGASFAVLSGEKCYGIDLQGQGTPQLDSLNFKWLGEFAQKLGAKLFINRARHFDLCIGTDRLRKAIEKGEDLADFSKSYQKELKEYLIQRQSYLLYERVN